jgi:hypothetical protein
MYGRSLCSSRFRVKEGKLINGLGCAFNLLKSLVESLLAGTLLYVGFPSPKPSGDPVQTRNALGRQT